MFTIKDTIDHIIQTEGGYVDHPNDSGGPTKYGITLATLEDYRGHKLDKSAVESLKKEEAFEIYEGKYVIAPGFNQIDDPNLCFMVVDAGVHSGPQRAAKWLQKSVGAVDDGIVGPATLKAVNVISTAGQTRKLFIAQRIRFLGRLIERDHKQAVFAAGWFNRISEQIEKMV